MRIEMDKTVVEIPDELVREYAVKSLNMKSLEDDIDKLVEARVTSEIERMISEDAEEILDAIRDRDDEVILEYARDAYDMMTADDFRSDWTEYVDDVDVEDYARNQLDMMTENEAADWAKEKLDS